MAEHEPDALERAKRSWSWGDEGLGDRELDRRALAFAVLVRSIAERGAAYPSTFAEALDLTPGSARNLFESMAALGVERDESGKIVGAALTRTKTPHVLRLGERVLYAWCALDALFIPGLLGRTLEIESHCPSTDAAVRLTVSEDRVEARDPDDVWLSIFLPTGSANPIGPATPTWSQMYFFHAREAAEAWVSERDGVAALSLDEAFELARTHWVERARRGEKAQSIAAARGA